MDPLNLFTTEHCRVSQARSFDLPGYVIVETKRSHRSLSAMTPVERADLVECLSKAERLVRAHTAAERVYALRFGEESEQVHFHVVPRTPDVLAAYLRSRDDDPPYSGARIVDWLWFHHGELGHSRQDALNWVELVRHQCRSSEEQPAAWSKMAEAAACYCEWIASLPLLPEEERDPSRDRAAHSTRSREARKHLLAVIAAASELEDVEPSGIESTVAKVGQSDWKETFDRVAALPIGFYRTVSHDDDLTDDLAPEIGDVGDDLADIWRDLKNGLNQWRAGDRASAVWDWRDGFRTHWGSHAVDALRQCQGWISDYDPNG